MPSSMPTCQGGPVVILYTALCARCARQKGLAGIDLGNFLIKRVAELLRQEFSHLQTLLTASSCSPWHCMLQKGTSCCCQLAVLGRCLQLQLRIPPCARMHDCFGHGIGMCLAL